DKPRQGAVAISLSLYGNGAVGFIAWLGLRSAHLLANRFIICVHLPLRNLTVADHSAKRHGSAPSRVWSLKTVRPVGATRYAHEHRLIFSSLRAETAANFEMIIRNHGEVELPALLHGVAAFYH